MQIGSATRAYGPLPMAVNSPKVDPTSSSSGAKRDDEQRRRAMAAPIYGRNGRINTRDRLGMIDFLA